MYHYHGTADEVVALEFGEANADWSESHGANVKKDFIEGYSHTFPVSSTDTDPFHFMQP